MKNEGLLMCELPRLFYLVSEFVLPLNLATFTTFTINYFYTIIIIIIIIIIHYFISWHTHLARL